jgi:hypothetical protein
MYGLFSLAVLASVVSTAVAGLNDTNEYRLKTELKPHQRNKRLFENLVSEPPIVASRIRVDHAVPYLPSHWRWPLRCYIREERLRSSDRLPQRNQHFDPKCTELRSRIRLRHRVSLVWRPMSVRQ